MGDMKILKEYGSLRGARLLRVHESWALGGLKGTRVSGGPQVSRVVGLEEDGGLR